MRTSTIATQTRQLNVIWQDMMYLAPRLRGLLPDDLVRARERLQSSAEAKQFGHHQLLIFFRIGLVLSQRAEPLTMGELREELTVPLSTATRLVDWLVRAGYVERLPDAQDRRVVRVHLTETGSELYETLSTFINQRLQKFLYRFTPQERENLVALLSKLTQIMRELGK